MTKYEPSKKALKRIKKRATLRAALKFYVTKVSSLKIKED